MFTRIRRYPILVGLTILFLSIGIVCAIIYSVKSTFLVNNNSIAEIHKVVIDPGHGGVDPGAIGLNKTQEKDINLAISLCLKDILISNGYEVIMTRESDIAIHDEHYKSISKIKTSDLKNRLKIIEDNPDAITISIHQNKFQSESSHGAQMFYGRKNIQSKMLAQSIQDAFVEKLQPDNQRKIKQSTSSVYIIHNATTPITLVECGFLSNRQEEELLIQEEYQQKVAFTIFCGIVKAQEGPIETIIPVVS